MTRIKESFHINYPINLIELLKIVLFIAENCVQHRNNDQKREKRK